jgi:hypothetical protein
VSASGPTFLRPDWPAPPGVQAAFSLRTGGVSAAPWESLNLGTHVGDDPTAVAENRRRLVEALALPAEPLWLEQVHGIDVVDADARAVPRGDAVVAAAAGRVCAIQVADCLPVLFATVDGARIGAAHAGWRGLAAGVLEATVAALGVAPSRLMAWLGPAIGPRDFEVGDEVREAFLGRPECHAGDPAAAFRRNARGRWDCDLYELARQRLARLGVASVWGGGESTLADPTRFYSHRRGAPTGRHAALIWRAAPVPTTGRDC